MKTKKILASILILGLLGFNMLPALAVNSTQTKLTKKQKKELAEKQSKIDYVNMRWWEEFDDENLNYYILKAVENNYDLKIATLKVEEARQNVKIQFASELPSFTVGAAPGIGKLPGANSAQWNFMLPMIASYEIDIFLKNHDKTSSVRKIYEASKYSEQASYVTVASTVGSVYYNIVKADKMIDVQQQIVSHRKEIFELEKLRNENGISSTSDLVKAEKQFILSNLKLSALMQGREKLLTTLAVLIGDSPENINSYKRISYDDLKIKKKIPESIPSDIITQRPDYKAAEKMIEKAGIDVRVAKKEFLPTFNIGGLLTFLTTQSTPMGWESALAGAGLMGLLPVFTGGRRIANLKIRKNIYEQKLQEYYKTNITAMKEVNDALCDLKYNTEKYEKDVKALEKEKEDFVFTQNKYNVGIISKLDLIQKEEVMLVTKQSEVDENINTYISQISLYQAVAASDL